MKIALSRTISEINVVLHFMQNCRMEAKKWPENDFWQKHFVEISHCF